MTESSRRLFIRHAGLVAAGPVFFDTFRTYASNDFPRCCSRLRRRPVPRCVRRGAAPIASTKLADRLVMLSGPGGGMSSRCMGRRKARGRFIRSTGLAQLKSALDGLDGGAIKTLIDTHWH
jgi:hypothetical protein